jgi:hypothetical protein
LAASTARRRGAAANVTRISPVLYSAVKASTPRTVTAITAYSRLMTAGSSGSAPDGRRPEGVCGAALVLGVLAKATATTALTATGVTTATSRVQKVERTERNLVHSDASRSRARVAKDGLAGLGLADSGLADSGLADSGLAGAWALISAPLGSPCCRR